MKLVWFINILLYLRTDFIFIFWISRFDLWTCDIYFTILGEVFSNHISTENTYFVNLIERREHNIMVLKPISRHQIIQWTLFWTISSISIILLFFTEPKMTNCKLEAINHSNIYLLFDLLWSHKTCTFPPSPSSLGGKGGGGRGLKISEKSLLEGGGSEIVILWGGRGGGVA